MLAEKLKILSDQGEVSMEKDVEVEHFLKRKL